MNGVALSEKMAWGMLVHLGMNLWHETPYQTKWRNMEDPVLAEAIVAKNIAADHVRFDEDVWQRVTGRFKAARVNQIVIDLGEAIVYPSHPEIAVKGSWSVEKLRCELVRLRAMGFEPIPKLNFSTTHDLWLGNYHRMVSSPEYYRVVADLIRDVCEMFDHPRYFHLGLDEETPNHQEKGQRLIVIRHGELWRHDVLFYVREVERHGSRAWMWGDYLRHHEPAEFAWMPKSVVQSPWWYFGDMDPETDIPAKAMVRLAELGYDVVPCSSTCYNTPDAMGRVVEFSRKTYDPAHVLGFQMAPWLEMNAVFERRWGESADMLSSAIGRWTV